MLKKDNNVLLASGQAQSRGVKNCLSRTCREVVRMKWTALLGLLCSLVFLPPSLGVEVEVKSDTGLYDRSIPNRIIIQIPAGSTFSAERVEGDWLLGVYLHDTGVSRGMIRKDVVLDPEKLAKLEEEYLAREKIREEQEMLAKGFVKYEGKWMRPEDKARLEKEKFEQQMRDKGYVNFEGQWLPREEKDRIIRERYAAEVKSLIATLKNPQASLEQKDLAEKRLLEIDVKEPAIQPLIDELKGRDRAMRGRAAVLLGKMGDEKVLAPLVAALADEDACAGAATGLGHLRSRKAVNDLVKALQDEDAVRAAAEALGKIGDIRAVDPLIKVVQNFFEDDATHAAAAKALGLIGAPSALDPLKKIMENDKNPLVRDAAREAYNRIKGSLPPQE
jgi:hypothetical protein